MKARVKITRVSVRKSHRLVDCNRIDIENAVIVDVEATSARTYDEVERC